MRILSQSNNFKLRLIISPLCIVLIVCSIIGMLLCSASINELNQVNYEVVTDKLMVIINDLEYQCNTMREIAYAIQNQLYYRKQYLYQNQYHEVELLKNLHSYKDHIQIAQDYFFMYQNDTSVYKSTNAKNPFNIFMNHYNITEDMNNFYKTVSSISQFTIFPCSTGNNDKLIFGMPVYTEGKSEVSSAGTIGFFVSSDSTGIQILC